MRWAPNKPWCACAGIEEVNIFKNNDVINFSNPKVQASIAANTYVISGPSQVKKLRDLLPGIMQQVWGGGVRVCSMCAGVVCVCVLYVCQVVCVCVGIVCACMLRVGYEALSLTLCHVKKPCSERSIGRCAY